MQAKRIAILATTCKGCGSVKVYWNGNLLKTISLDSATTANRKLQSVVSWTSVHKGTLVIKVSSSARKVIIDGVAIGRT